MFYKILYPNWAPYYLSGLFIDVYGVTFPKTTIPNYFKQRMKYNISKTLRDNIIFNKMILIYFRKWPILLQFVALNSITLQF